MENGFKNMVCGFLKILRKKKIRYKAVLSMQNDRGRNK